MNNIEILEDYIKLINKGFCSDCNELCNIYGTPAFPSKAIAKAIENLIKENKELKEKNKKIEELENVTFTREEVIYLLKECEYLMKNSIPKSKLKEKIEELEEQLKYNLFKNHEIYTVLENKIEVLQELLEEKMEV